MEGDTLVNRRRQNRRHVYTILILWAILFMMDPSMTGDMKKDKKKKKKIHVQSSDNQLTPSSEIAGSSTGPSSEDSNNNVKNKMKEKIINPIYNDFIIKPIGDNGASFILDKAAASNDGINRFPRNVSVNLKGWWRQTTQRAKLATDNVTVVVQLQEHSIVRDTKLTLTEKRGNFTMYLRARATLSPLISTVDGTLYIYNGVFDDSRPEIIRMNLKGLYLRRTGRLCLFSNAISPHFGIHYGTKTKIINKTKVTTTTATLDNEDDVINIHEYEKNKSISSSSNRRRQLIDETINKKKNKKNNLRPVPRGKNLCFFRMDLNVRARNDSSLKFIKRYGGSNAGEPIGIDGFSRSPFNCNNLQLEFSGTGLEIKLDVTYKKASTYAMLYCIVVAWQWYLCVKQMEHINTPSSAIRMSMISIGLQGVIDAGICISHMMIAIASDSIFQAFSLLAFLKLVVFSIFELRLLLMVWKARRPAAFNDGFVVMRRELGKIYSRFYCSLILFVAFVYHMWDFSGLLLMLVYSFWIPQIFTNAYYDSKKPLTDHYMYGISLSRLFFPLYFYGCPNNHVSVLIRWEYKPYAAFFLLLWMGLQVSLLRIQEIYGARILIPKQFLPVKYDYKRKVILEDIISQDDDKNKKEKNDEDDENDSKRNTEVEDDDDNESDNLPTCSICLNSVNIRDRLYLVTPCDHFFHDECLEQWMDVKHECPVCRANLPPL